MKKMKFLRQIFIILVFFISVSSCNTQNEEKSKEAEQTETSTMNDDKNQIQTHEHNKTAATIYQCPMKCEGDKTYTEKEKCPKCGMDMEELKN